MIKDKILNIRGKQVILDFELAELYEVETKRLNEAVKRNIDRFPEDFMFQLDEEEINSLRSQIVTLDNNTNLKSQNVTSKFDSLLRSQIATSNKGGRRYIPYAFTEQGIAMLSGILRSKKAIEVNIKIMRAFVAMRKIISRNIDVISRIDNVEKRQIEYQIEVDDKFDKVFDAIEKSEVKQGIFYEGQIFDAHIFVSKLIKSAKKEIILIDNYVDSSVLALFCDSNVDVKIITRNITDKLRVELEKYNSQYKEIKVEISDRFHDRFLIIDDVAYHFGASIKDLGKKIFAFSKMDKSLLELRELYGKHRSFSPKTRKEIKKHIKKIYS